MESTINFLILLLLNPFLHIKYEEPIEYTKYTQSCNIETLWLESSSKLVFWHYIGTWYEVIGPFSFYFFSISEHHTIVGSLNVQLK